MFEMHPEISYPLYDHTPEETDPLNDKKAIKPKLNINPQYYVIYKCVCNQIYHAINGSFSK